MTAFSIDPDSPLTAWGQVQKDLQHRVEIGEMAPGERLPAETRLAEQYGVSRATVRRAIASLTEHGLLRAKRGSGTFVSENAGQVRLDVNLLRPWREQLLATGHVARSRLLTHRRGGEVPAELMRFVEYDEPQSLRFGMHLQEVDGVPIAITESWTPASEEDITAQRLRTAPAIASGVVRIAFAHAAQATTLNTPVGTALFEVTTCSRLRETGELAELARTSWVASRVRLGYSRALTVGQIDMSELLSYGAQDATDAS